MEILSFDRLVGVIGLLLAVAAIGFGLAMDTRNRAEVRASIACFVVASLGFLCTIGVWTVTTELIVAKRIIITALLCAAVGVLLLESIRWTVARHEAKTAEKDAGAQSKPRLAPIQTFVQFARTGFVLSTPDHIFLEGRPITVAFEVKNVSSVGVARDVKIMAGYVFLAPGEGLGVKEEDKFDEFHAAWLNMEPRLVGEEIGAGDNRIRDLSTKPLENASVYGLLHEQLFFYIVGLIKWTDDTGTWESQVYSHLLVKRSNLQEGLAVWQECQSGVRHNFVRHPYSD